MTALPRVRPATATDLPAVAGIFGHYARHTLVTFEEEPRPLAAWAALHTRLAGLGLPFLVAESGDVVTGYACASPWRPKPGYRHTAEDSVFVAPEETGRGVGRALLGGLLAACGPAGVRQLIAVIADTGDPASAALHAAAGFTVAGRLAAVGCKHGRWIDTVLMQRATGSRGDR